MHGAFLNEATSASVFLESHIEVWKRNEIMMLIKGRIYCGKEQVEMKWFGD